MAKKELTSNELNKKVLKKLKPIYNLSFIEQYGIFMAKVQVVELILKNLIIDKYSYDEEKIEKCTLGQIIAALEKEGLRADFIKLLKDLNEFRIAMAHNFLADNIVIMDRLKIKNPPRLTTKILTKGLYCLENVIVVYDFLNEKKLF